MPRRSVGSSVASNPATVGQNEEGAPVLVGLDRPTRRLIPIRHLNKSQKNQVFSLLALSKWSAVQPELTLKQAGLEAAADLRVSVRPCDHSALIMAVSRRTRNLQNVRESLPEKPQPPEQDLNSPPPDVPAPPSAPSDTIVGVDRGKKRRGRSGRKARLPGEAAAAAAAKTSFKERLTIDNLETYYNVAADIMLNAGVAVRNPDYDPTVPRSEMLIITHPERIFSFDETRVELDCTKGGKRKGDRIVRDGKHDRGEGLSTKSSATATVACGRTGIGENLPPYTVFASGSSTEAVWHKEKHEMFRRKNYNTDGRTRNMMGWREEGLIPFNRNELWNLREELERIYQNATWSCAAASITTMLPLEASTAASKARSGRPPLRERSTNLTDPIIAKVKAAPHLTAQAWAAWEPAQQLEIFLQHQQIHAEILAATQPVEEDNRGPPHDAEEGEEEEELDPAVLKTKIRAPRTFWCQRGSLTSEESIANARLRDQEIQEKKRKADERLEEKQAKMNRAIAEGVIDGRTVLEKIVSGGEAKIARRNKQELQAVLRHTKPLLQRVQGNKAELMLQHPPRSHPCPCPFPGQ
eukprot:jgi/Tetstr1/462225/TSEL_000624.t1